MDKLKLKLGIKDNSKDDLLALLIEEAETDILEYTNRIILLPKMDTLVRDLAIYRYKEIERDSEISRSEGAVSVSYDTSIPLLIKDKLRIYRRSKLVSCIENKKS